MAERVLITTHHLETAVRLKEAFADHKLAVELLTPSEDIEDVEDPALLILTGGLDGKRARRKRHDTEREHGDGGVLDAGAGEVADGELRIGHPRLCDELYRLFRRRRFGRRIL